MPCREHLAQLREHQEELDQLGAAVVVVTFEPPEQTRRYVEREGIPYTILSDRERRLYAAFGLRRGSTRELYNRRSLGAYIRGLREGRLPRLPSGDTHQLGGDFVLDAEGRVVYIYRSEDPADRPAMEVMLAAVRAVASEQQNK